MTRPSTTLRLGITLLEIVLAMGLSAMLLYAVGMAMDLHFRALDVQRTRVERSQVARAVLRHISDDVRSAMQQMPVDLEGLKEAAKNQKAAQSMVMTALGGQTGQQGQNGNGQNGSGNSGGNSGPRGGGQSGGNPGGGQGGAPPGGIPGGGNIPALPPGFDPSSIPGGTLPPGVSLPPGFNAGNLQAAAAAVGGGIPGASNPASSSPGSGGQGGAGAAGGGRGGSGGMGAGGMGGGGRGGQAGGQGRGGQGGQGGQGQGGGQRGGSGGGQGGSKSGSGGSSRGGGSGGGTAGGTGGAGSSGGSMQISGVPNEDAEEETGPATIVGLFGSATQLQFDISRLPRLDQYTSSDGQVPSDIQTVIYYLGSLASSTSGVADTSAAASGLMRVQRERAATSFAESSGDSASSFAGGKLIASEVAAVQFRYFSGEEWLESWDSDEQGGLPLAVEAEIMLADLDYEVAQTMLSGSGTGNSAKTTEPQMYKMVIPIPVAKPGANLPEETTEETEEEASSGTGSSGSSSSGSR